MKRTARHVPRPPAGVGRAAVARAIARSVSCGDRSAGAADGTAGTPGGAGSPGTTGAGTTPGAEPGVLATLGGEPIPYKSFDRYLADNGMDDTGNGEQDDVIKSHLLDQFLEEQLMLRAARGLKVAVSEA